MFNAPLKWSFLALAMAIAVSGCGGLRDAGAPSAAASAASAEPDEPEYQRPDDLAVGDCFDPIEDADDDWLLGASMRDCDTPHRWEVVGMKTLRGGPAADYPGDASVERTGDDLCVEAFRTYVGIDVDDSRYDFIFYPPSEETWATGDRTVWCFAYATGQTLAESIKGSKR